MTETQLTALLEQHYATIPRAVRQLAGGEKGVFLVERATQPAWIVRDYPAQMEQGTIRLTRLLHTLETQAFPAERVVFNVEGGTLTPNDDRHIVITTYLGAALKVWQPASSSGPLRADEPHVWDTPTLMAIGALLGHLHVLDMTQTAVQPIDWYGLQAVSELNAAQGWLAEIAEQIPTHLSESYEALRRKILAIRSFARCPETLIHGDGHLGNVVVTPAGGYVFIDWEAAGRGAAITDLGLLLSSCIQGTDPNANIARIHAITDGYCRVRALLPIERNLLADAIRFRILVTLAGAFEEYIQPTFQPTQRFWGRTYHEWEQLEQDATWIAAAVIDRLDV